MQPEVEVILASETSHTKPIWSIRTRHPRMIHAELLTHRVFSRNASSSRAIPVHKLASVSTDDMFVPMFRKNKPGMQPGDFLSADEQAEAEAIWTKAAHACYQASQELSNPNGLNVHKQWANRPLEWFGHINVLITSTEWENFEDLRLELGEDGHPIAQDEMYDLARAIKVAMNNYVPKKIKGGEWHLPYVTDEEKSSEQFSIQELKKMSAARCASISYQTVDGKPMTWDRAVSLCDKLLEKKHYSPFEHQAMADSKIDGFWCHKKLHANYDGWAQWRGFLAEAGK